MDSNTPATSHTGRLHGMPLAWLLGEDDDPLYGLTTGVLDPAHVSIVGVRSFETEEADRLERLGVRVFMMDEVRRRGLQPVLDEALAIATGGTAGFGISIDLDAVTPEEAPGVGTPVAGGLGAGELAAALRRIGGRPGLSAVELVEYCPRLDADGCSARVAVDLLGVFQRAGLARKDQDLRALEDLRRRRRLEPAVDDDAQRLARRLHLAHGKARIVCLYGADAGEHGAGASAPAVAVPARLGSRDPLRRPIRQRAAPIERRRRLQANPRPAARHARHEADVQLARRFLHQPVLDADAGRRERRAAAGGLRVRVRHRRHHARDLCVDQCRGAGWCSAVMVAGLEIDVDRGTGRIAFNVS